MWARSGIIVSLVGVGILFLADGAIQHGCRRGGAIDGRTNQELTLRFDSAEASGCLPRGRTGSQIDGHRASLAIIYSYGDLHGGHQLCALGRWGGGGRFKLRAKVPCRRIAVEAFFKNPFADLEAARTAPLRLEGARRAGAQCASWLAGGARALPFMAFYAMGPGVCVWLALSELMPTRIRSNGMSIALVINQLVSTTLAGIFLPFVSKYGYSSMFFLFSGFTVVYFVTATSFSGDQGEDAGRD